MTEHLCVVCQRRPYERAMVCNGCRTWLDRTLAEIVQLYAMLPAQLVPGQTQGQRVSGSREAPLPLRVDPLDLSMPARAATVHDTLGDQIGHISVASRLDAWAQDWRTSIRCGDVNPAPTVVELVRWLRIWLDEACDHHGAIDEFAGEMRQLRHTLRTVNEVSDVRPEHLDVPCRRCDLLDLHRLPGQDRVECGSCGDLLTEDEYRRWVGLLASTVAHA